METTTLHRRWLYAAAALLAAALVGLMAITVERATPDSRGWKAACARDRVHVAQWPRASRSVAELMLDRLGPADRAQPEALTWRGRGSWKRTVVHRRPAGEPLEQVATYHVPEGKREEVRALGLGLKLVPGREELSARSSREEWNFLAVNLADDVVTGRRTPEAAREFYAATVALSAAGKSSAYLEGLLFRPHRGRNAGRELWWFR